jgi:hypothetical protein
MARKMLVMIWHRLRGENYEDIHQQLYSRKLIQLAWKAGCEGDLILFILPGLEIW